MEELTKGRVFSRREALKAGAAFGTSAFGASVLGGCASSHEGAKASKSDEALVQEASGSSNADIRYETSDYDSIKSKTEAAESGHYDFKYANQPIALGDFTLKNRIVKSASSGFECSGTMEAEVEHYRKIARGGASMIVYAVKDPMKSNEEASQYTPIVEALHEEGVPVFVQVLSESEDRSSTIDLHAPMGRPLASKEMADAFGMTMADMTNFITPGAFTMLSTEDLQVKLEGLAQSALHLKNAGFDGIELNAAAEHFFDSFLSRFWNRERDDQYGPQSLENRARVVTELIARIHELCGEDFPVGVLFNGYEVNGLFPGDDSLCSTLEETRAFAKIFENAGASHLQVRSVVFGNHCAGFFPDLMFANNRPDTTYGRYYDIKRWWPEFNAEYGGAGAFLDTAAKIKEVVSIPVMVVGMEDLRLLPDVIDEAIGSGKIDLVAMTRRIIADMDYPNKVLSGDLLDVRPCANCTHCLQGTCRVNPTYGRAYHSEMEEGFDPAKASASKKVLIAGGGPAGLEAAHIAAERGHEVTLCEAKGSWGGLANTAIAVKGPHEKIKDHIDWLVHECEKQNVTMELNTEVTKEMVEKIMPDAFIQATGGTRHVPNIPGIDHEMVTSDYLAEGEDIVVLGGMECEGTEVAVLLADQGKKVTLIDSLSEDDFALLMPTWSGHAQKYYCQTHGVRVYGGVSIDEISDEGVSITLNHDGIKKTVPCDAVVLAYPPDTDSSLMDQVKDIVSEAYAVGDCSARGLIRDAVREGNLVARGL